ncbi:hypothetical protein A33Q_4280 [Indibacter alkaliphilus LW1]|uniref:Uncharacterized protein n=1 Tax=Indibacter alkaliphilus (strain CCUG 57479 / KCTC 22604 / LW1) TaxID=1189612 RepID=S2CYE6_INDAL|nr:hypothetical protein A33Q_4280 [Indibacter alkaliphilus LW1]
MLKLTQSNYIIGENDFRIKKEGLSFGLFVTIYRNEKSGI